MEGNRLQRQLKPSSYDPATCENSVDEAQQVAASAENLLDALSLLGRRSVQLQQLRKAQDRVQGRAKLVAHPRQELALRLIRAAGLGGCGAQLSSALLHPGLELFRLPLDALVETRLRAGRRQPLDLAGFQIEQVHDRARQTEQVS